VELRSGYKQTEVGIIPEEWDAVPLSRVGQFKNGINKDSEAFGRGSPFVNLMDVFGVSSIKSGDGFGLVKTSEAEQKTYDLKRGDVIFIRSSVKPSGIGLTAVVEADLPNTVYSGFLIRFRDNDALDIAFKRHCFYSENFRSKLIGASSVSANTNINQDNLKKLLIALPPTAKEQRAIAEALSDVDGLLGGLDRLIAKKRDLKQAAMQQLLTGQTRLPGFTGEWEVKRLGDVLKVRHGKSQHDITASDGKYPILASGGEIGRTNTYIYDQPSVLIGRKGTIDSPQYVDRPFWTVDTLFFTEISSEANAKFVFYKFTMIRWRSYNEASGVPSLNAKTIENIEVTMPSLPEQTAIAAVLSDMDAELAALEARRDKTRALKQAMMQELLTGRTRLV
jgi:type I restriction enzyme S subunit